MGTLSSLIPLRGCNVIVTGAVGGVGSVLMSALEELDCRVVGIDLPAAVASGAVAVAGDHPPPSGGGRVQNDGGEDGRDEKL